MAIKGSSQEVKNNLVTGVAEVKVICAFPTLADYTKIYGEREPKEGEEVKEPEYLKVDAEGNNMLLATFIVEDVLSGKKQKLVFPIVEKIDLKESGNTLFVNDKGETTYVDIEENLKDYFTQVKKYNSGTKEMLHFRDCKVRKGYSGEKALLDFLSCWLNFEFSNDAETEIWLDMAKMFKGNYKELKGVVDAFTVQTVGTAWHVTTKENEGVTKQYQNIYRGAFFNTRTRKSNLMAIFTNLNSRGTDWGAWVEANKKDWSLKNLRNFITQVTGDYKPDGFVLKPLGEYDPASDLAASSQTKHENPEFQTNNDY